MVRKISALLVACALLFSATCATASAATHSVYDEGNISSTYVTYFRDIVSGIGFNENYVAFRSGQYSYTMVVGDLEYIDGIISLSGVGSEYVITTSSGYSSDFSYNVNYIDVFSVDTGDSILYSDVGDYPQLVDRGAKYEILTSILLLIICCSVVIARIFTKR